MAIISQIRKRGTLIIGFVGLSMLLFILGDVVTSNSGLFSGTSDVVGVINGEKIHYREYEARVDKMIENYKINTKQDNVDQNTADQIRDQLWTLIVDENTLGKEYEKLGLSCDKDELYDMATGKNVDQKIRQAFTDSTGNFNPQTVVRFLNDLPNREEKLQQQWSEFEKSLVSERIADKYKSLIKGSMYVTASEAKAAFNDQNRSASVRYVAEHYRSIPDSTATVSQDELEKYYEQHKNEYKQEQSVRKVEYVTFEVSPSEEDRQKAMERVVTLKPEFQSSTDMASFLTQNSDGPFDSTYHTQTTLPPALTGIISLPLDTVIGPYTEDNSIKLAKITKERFQPDSVKARHILLKIAGDTAAVMARADSMKSAAKKSKKVFEEMAKSFSQDFGSGAKGGDLGWFKPGMMVGEFNDACFNGKKGDMPIVTTQFGVHLIEITEQAKPARQIQVAVLEHKMEPSQKTYDNFYLQANEFAAANTTGALFDKAAKEKGLHKGVADNLKENDKNITGLEQPRELIRWAFTAKRDEISKVFTLGNAYVVAHLTDIRDKGILPLEAVREQVTAGARIDKKAEMLIEKFNKALKESKTLDELAAKLNTQVKSHDALQFANPSFPEIGRELHITGTLFSMEQGKMSSPLKGESVVMVAMVNQFTEPPKDADVTAMRTQKLSMLKQRSEYEIPGALKEKANIEDHRGKFY